LNPRAFRRETWLTPSTKSPNSPTGPATRPLPRTDAGPRPRPDTSRRFGQKNGPGFPLDGSRPAVPDSPRASRPQAGNHFRGVLGGPHCSGIGGAPRSALLRPGGPKGPANGPSLYRPPTRAHVLPDIQMPTANLTQRPNLIPCPRRTLFLARPSSRSLDHSAHTEDRTGGPGHRAASSRPPQRERASSLGNHGSSLPFLAKGGDGTGPAGGPQAPEHGIRERPGDSACGATHQPGARRRHPGAELGIRGGTKNPNH